MKNNQIGNISVQTDAKKRSRFNLAHDVNTSAGFGDTQPLVCRECVPGTKTMVDIESLVRLAPMPVPTFGRIKFKTWSQFVECDSLMKHFDAFLAETVVSEGGTRFTPTSVPYMPLGLLTSWVLAGSRCTIWFNTSGNEGSGVASVASYNTSDSAHDVNAQTLYKKLIDAHYLFTSAAHPNFNGFEGASVSIERLFNAGAGFGYQIPLDNRAWWDYFLGNSAAAAPNEDYWSKGAVSLESADYVHTVTLADSSVVHFAFRLSSLGKRLRKIFIGLGYQIDFRNSSTVSLMPLFAYFKAYFDIFGLTLYENYETSHAASILTRNDYLNTPNFALIFDSEDFGNFIYDLANTWATAPQDYVSSHLMSTTVSKANQTPSIIDVTYPNSTHIANPANPDGSQVSGHSYINDVIHGHLDSELLKRMYKWTNRNTIAGKRIAEVLRAQGLGKYVDECKSNFIGMSETDIQISDVVATADTFSDGKGTLLGEYGGRGLKYDKSKTLVYENEKQGYWITFCSIIPEGGYCQTVDSGCRSVAKLDFYNPMYDGLGYRANMKCDVVTGAVNWTSSGQGYSEGSLTDTFGFVPQYSQKKVAFNKLNGDFSLRSSRNGYLPYTLDKFIDVGERNVSFVGLSSNNPVYMVEKVLPIKELPTAGLVWRYYYRYQWLNNFNRMFINGGNLKYFRSNVTLSAAVDAEVTAVESDNFLVHNIVNMIQFAPMLPISDSYETVDDNGGAISQITKA